MRVPFRHLFYFTRFLEALLPLKWIWTGAFFNKPFCHGLGCYTTDPVSLPKVFVSFSSDLEAAPPPKKITRDRGLTLCRFFSRKGIKIMLLLLVFLASSGPPTGSLRCHLYRLFLPVGKPGKL